MKKLKNMIALIVILIILSGTYFYVKNRPAKKDYNTKNTAAVSTISIWKLDKDKISKIISNFENNSITYVKEGSSWNILNNSYKLDNNLVSTIVDSAINLSAVRIVEKEPKSLDKYGLSVPKNNVKIVLNDNKEKVLYVGSKTSDEENYYVKTNGDNTVYLLETSVVENFSKTITDLRDKSITAIDAQKLSYIKIVQSDKKPIEISLNTNQSKNEAQYGINSWILSKPYDYPMLADEDVLNNILSVIQNIRANDIIEDNPKELGKYGLDKPSLDLTLKDDKNSLHIILGKVDADKGNVYFKTDESSTIYTMDNSIMKTFQVEPFSLLQKFIYIVNIDNVDKIVVDSNGKKDIITLLRTTKKAEKQGEEDTVTTTYNVNGKNVEEKSFKAFYQELVGLTIDSENDKTLNNKPEISITYSLNKGDVKEQKIDFVSYNDEFYAVFMNGRSYFVVSKDKVNRMITNLRNLK